MDQRAKISVVLIGVALATCIVVAAGVGASPSSRRSEIVPERISLGEIASPAELKLWNERGCVTCHGAEAAGSEMGPDLTRVVPLYVQRFGDAARSRLAAYIVDPKDSPKQRADGVTYRNPMPAIERMPGGRREDADVLADLLLRLAR